MRLRCLGLSLCIVAIILKLLPTATALPVEHADSDPGEARHAALCWWMSVAGALALTATLLGLCLCRKKAGDTLFPPSQIAEVLSNIEIQRAGFQSTLDLIGDGETLTFPPEITDAVKGEALETIGKLLCVFLGLSKQIKETERYIT